MLKKNAGKCQNLNIAGKSGFTNTVEKLEYFPIKTQKI